MPDREAAVRQPRRRTLSTAGTHSQPGKVRNRLNARRRYRLSGNRRRSHDFVILFFMPTSDCRFLKQPPPVGGRIQQHCTRRVSLRWRRTRTRTAVTGHVFGYSEAMVGQLLTSRVTRQVPLTPWGKSTSPVSNCRLNRSMQHHPAR